MKWLTTIGTDGVVTLSARAKTNNETTLFYILDGNNTGSEKWTGDGVTVWRKNNFVEVYINKREESDGDFTLCTLPANLRPPRTVIAPLPTNSTGVNGITSKFSVESFSIRGCSKYTYLPSFTTVVGRAEMTFESFYFRNSCEYEVNMSILDSEKVPVSAANAEGGQWDMSGQYTLNPLPLQAGRRGFASTYIIGADMGYSNYSAPGTYQMFMRLEGGGYSEDVPFELVVTEFFIYKLTISYYSTTNGFDVSEGDEASFGFTLETSVAVPADCDLYIYEGQELIYHEEEAVMAGEKQSASLTTIYAEDFEDREPWSASDVGNRTVTFVLRYTSGNNTLEVKRDATIKVTNGGA